MSTDFKSLNSTIYESCTSEEDFFVGDTILIEKKPLMYNSTFGKNPLEALKFPTIIEIIVKGKDAIGDTKGYGWSIQYLLLAGCKKLRI